MRISDWSSAVCSSDLHRPEHLPRDDLRETRNRVERAAQFVDQLADRIARIFGRGPAIGRFIALRTPRARAIAAKLAGRRIEPGQRRKAPFTSFGGPAFQPHARVDDLRPLTERASGHTVAAGLTPEGRPGDRTPHHPP